MGANTKIEWCDFTFNHVRGCTKISPGCANCYAETMSGRNPKTLGVWGPSGTRVVAAESYWREPLKWDRDAKAAGERRRVFCASLADVFEDWHGPMVDSKGRTLFLGDGSYHTEGPPDSRVTMDDVRERLFFLIRDTPYLDWLLLTKRPENILSTYGRLDVHDPDAVLPNLWLGVSVEDQQRADERIPLLLQCPAAVRFLSCEPLLGPVSLWQFDEDSQAWTGPGCFIERGTTPSTPDSPPEGYDNSHPGIDWVIVGGESGPAARPFNLRWARSLRDQCRAAGVPYFLKQLGSCPVPETDADRHRLTEFYPWGASKWGDPDEWPADLRVREFPVVKGANTPDGFKP